MQILENNPEFTENLSSTAKKFLLPALLASAGTGALTGYISSRNRPRNEVPGQRRKRIMKNALLGSALGGTAAAAIPLGMSALAQPFGFNGNSKGLVESGVDSVIDTGAKNLLPLGAAAGGGYMINRSLNQNKEQALKHILDLTQETDLPQGGKLKNVSQLRGMMQNVDGKDTLLTLLNAKLNNPAKPDAKNLFTANELIGEAGGKQRSLKDLTKFYGQDISAMEGITDTTAAPSKVDMTKAFKGHLEGQGPMSRLMAKLVGQPTPRLPEKMLGNAAGRFTDKMLQKINPTGIAEGYSRFIRPGAGTQLGRNGLLLKLLLLAGGTAGAHQVQKRLMGN